MFSGVDFPHAGLDVAQHVLEAGVGDDLCAQMADTSSATIVVSNMPAAPEPMLASRSVAAVAPVATMMIEPDRMPSNSTTNTFTPMMPPTSTMR